MGRDSGIVSKFRTLVNFLFRFIFSVCDFEYESVLAFVATVFVPGEVFVSGRGELPVARGGKGETSGKGRGGRKFRAKRINGVPRFPGFGGEKRKFDGFAKNENCKRSLFSSN